MMVDLEGLESSLGRGGAGKNRTYIAAVQGQKVPVTEYGPKLFLPSSAIPTISVEEMVEIVTIRT